MPKFGSHIIFAELARQKRPDLFPNTISPALRFGAVGPDTTLFMFDPATNNPNIRKGFDVALNILETISEIKDKLLAIEQLLSQPFDDLADWLSGGISTDIKYLVNTSIEAMFLATKLGIAWNVGTINIKNPLFGNLTQLPIDFIADPKHAAQYWVIGAVDNFGFPFRLFGHPFTDDGNWKQPVPPGNYTEWWWMDLLHYRYTGDFAKYLLSNASTPAQTSYARGYLTHVAGDISGHPFINRLVFGPFRNHAYRHLVLETMADTWLWDRVGRGDILDARLDTAIDVDDSELDQIIELLLSAMKAIYVPPMVPSLLAQGYPQKEEFAFAYRLLKRYLRLSTAGSVKRPNPPPDNIQAVWNEIKTLLQNNMPGALPQWNGSVVDFLTALFTWFGKGLVLLVMIATLPIAVLNRIVMLAPRWFLYLINLAVYFLVSAIRTMLCLTGWGYMGREDFNNFGFLENMITTGPFENSTYPARTVPNPKPPFYWLAFPRWPYSVEGESTVPLLPSDANLRPDWMINPNNAMTPATVAALVSLNDATTPVVTRNIVNSLQGSNGFGNAVDFSIALLDQQFPIPNLDLDGDRGYGYRGWEQLPPNEHYV